MIAIWRTWTKILLAAGLIVGCNIVAPGLAVATGDAASAQAGSCHHGGQKGDVPMTMCKASCLAIAPVVAEVGVRLALSAPLQPARFRALVEQHSPPDTPPPRSL